MSIHPDGLNTTQRLLELADLPAGSRILDLGAGDGESVRWLRAQGYDATGLDRSPGPDVLAGDMLRLPVESGSFDCLLAECSLSVCGDTARALSEAKRALKPGGLLLVSDVYYTKAEKADCLSLPCPATKLGWQRAAAGFALIEFEDVSQQWLQFLIDCLWNDRPLGDCGFYHKAAKSGCGYFLSVWKGGKTDENRRPDNRRRLVLTHGKL